MWISRSSTCIPYKWAMTHNSVFICNSKAQAARNSLKWQCLISNASEACLVALKLAHPKIMMTVMTQALLYSCCVLKSVIKINFNFCSNNLQSKGMCKEQNFYFKNWDFYLLFWKWQCGRITWTVHYLRLKRKWSSKMCLYQVETKWYRNVLYE